MEYIFEAIKWIATAILAFIAFYFKKEHARLEAQDKHLQAELKNLDEKLHDFKIEAGREFVTKDEYIRSMSGFQKSLDNIGSKLDKIRELQVKQGIEIAAGGGKRE